MQGGVGRRQLAALTVITSFAWLTGRRGDALTNAPLLLLISEGLLIPLLFFVFECATDIALCGCSPPGLTHLVHINPSKILEQKPNSPS